MPENNVSKDPSLHVGDMTREDDLHEVIAQAIALFEMSDDEFEDAASAFVVKRMAELSNGASTEFMTNKTKGTEDFIVPERPQEITGIMTKSFLMDDPELYVKEISWVRHQFKELQSSNPEFTEDKTYMNAALRGTLVGQWEYFGSYVGDKNKLVRATADILDDEDGLVSGYVSIADIGAGAICQQRGSAVHNALRILGINSKFETGDLSEISGNKVNEPERHAYVVITRGGKRLLFDPTNPILTIKEDEGVTWLSPQIAEIPEGADAIDIELPEVVTRNDGTKQRHIAHTLRYMFN